MLVTFKSKAAAEVTMYAAHARPLLELIHKDVKRGVITAAETATVIARLEAAIGDGAIHFPAEEQKHEAPHPHGYVDNTNDSEPSQFVSVSARAFPLLEMLRAAHKGGNDVLWGID